MNHPSQQNNQSTWLNLIKKVDYANLQQRQSIKQKGRHRSKAYIQQLQFQINQIQENKRKQQSAKINQKQEIQQLVKIQKQVFINSKLKKMKTEQKYRAENLQFSINQPRSKRDSQFQPQSPFIKLVDQQDQRLKQTKINFQQQNKFNDANIKIKNSYKKRQKQHDKKIGQKYEAHVELQYRNRDTDLQKFRKKYISLKDHETSLFNYRNTNSGDNIDRQYRSFLNEQMKLDHYRKHKNKYLIDEKEQKIQGHPEISSSSPAYLGRDYVQSDRRKQQQILDDHIRRTKQNRFYAGNCIRTQAHTQSILQMNPQDRYTSNQKNLQSGKGRVSLPPMPIATKMHTQSVIEPPLTREYRSSDRQYKILALKQQNKHNKKQYKYYDIIAGKSRNIYA